MSTYHQGIMVSTVCDLLNVSPPKKFIDATIGGGDHTAEILARGGSVLAFDRDINAINYCESRFEKQIAQGKLKLAHKSFENISSLANDVGFSLVDGILYDLGISSFQIDDGNRGFSFRFPEAQLDMRMGDQTNITASDLLNALPQKALEEILFKYGNISQTKKIVQEILATRSVKKILTVKDLLNILAKVNKNYLANDLAAKVFMSLRIAVNCEIEALTTSVSSSLKLLKSEGLLVFITFQSLEDAIIKNLGKREDLINLTKKPIVPSVDEVTANPRSRSAKIRSYEKL